MAYEPRVYKTSGGDVMVVSTGGAINLTGGALQINGVAFITSGGNIAMGSLTSGNINTTGSVIATSGLTGSSGTFTNGISGSSAAITNGITGSSLAITNGITGSSLAITNGITGSSLAITNGITGSSGTFTNGISGSSAAFTAGITMSSAAITNGITGSSLAITNGITGSSVSLTNGIAASTGTFVGAVSVGATLTASSGFVRAFESLATGLTNLASVGVSLIWSSGVGGSSEGKIWALAAATGPGIEKWLVCNSAVSTTPATVRTYTGGTLIDGTITHLEFSTGAVNRQWIHLLSENTTNWMTLSKSTDVIYVTS